MFVESEEAYKKRLNFYQKLINICLYMCWFNIACAIFFFNAKPTADISQREINIFLFKFVGSAFLDWCFYYAFTWLLAHHPPKRK